MYLKKKKKNFSHQKHLQQNSVQKSRLQIPLGVGSERLSQRKLKSCHHPWLVAGGGGDGSEEEPPNLAVVVQEKNWHAVYMVTHVVSL